MTNEEKRKLLNTLLTDNFVAEADGETCYYVFVKLDEEVKGVLNDLGYDDAFIEMHKDSDGLEEIFDLCLVAWDFADWFTGDAFIDKESEG